MAFYRTACVFLPSAVALLPASVRADVPLNYLTGAGDRADAVVPLTWALSIVSVAVIVIISLLVAGAIWRRPGIAMPAVGSKTGLEKPIEGLSWIWIGAGISTLVLLFTVVWTMVVLARVISPAAKPALTIEVTGHQWWWQVRYLSSVPAQVFSTANEIHIPTGQPVLFKLIGGDVIHSFWVPQLFGKTDLIPGQTNETWLEAHKPGIYRGQCTEYCGLQHAKMGMLLIADTPKDFRAWRAHQIQSATAPKTGGERAGQVYFNNYCGSCHAVRGTDAGGSFGPDLSHLMQRKTIAAGVLPNDAANLAHWISDPQGIKPGNLMQKPEVSPRELDDIQAYLKTLN
ncbi:MAG TPA: c-type cytochrome [Rhizomicrobium sp.]|nr:c-type cytochrome [Rhizomicrobium sp.]